MRRTLMILLCMLVPALASAQPARPWTLGIEAQTGVLVPTSMLGPSAIGALELEVSPPFLDDVSLALDASIARPTYRAAAIMSSTEFLPSYALEQTQIAIAALVNIRPLARSRRVAPYFGIGPAMQILDTNETTGVVGRYTTRERQIGFEVKLGVDVKAGPGFIGADVRVVHSANQPSCGPINAGAYCNSTNTALTGTSVDTSISLLAGYRVVY